METLPATSLDDCEAVFFSETPLPVLPPTEWAVDAFCVRHTRSQRRRAFGALAGAFAVSLLALVTSNQGDPIATELPSIPTATVRLESKPAPVAARPLKAKPFSTKLAMKRTDSTRRR